MSFSRRQFLETAALTAAAANAAPAMPTRPLGRTGRKVSIVAFGSGSRWLSYPTEEAALEAMNRALELGVTYIDTAFDYGKGLSETRVGKVLKARGGAKGLWVATKVPNRKGDEARRTIEGSLTRLGVSSIDLVHIHSLTDEKDLAAIEAPDGVLKALYKLRDEKVVRHIGVTSHTDPMVLKTALERHDFDCTQMALNAARVGMPVAEKIKEPRKADGFETLALPVANRKKMGVIAMKIFGQEALNGKAPVEKLISYALSLPVAAAVLGMPKPEHIEQNIAVAKAFQPLSKTEMDGLANALLPQKASMDRFFAHHVDA
ncbi:MAG: aldo/keto reductase [Bryobacteraceae bacterium]|nr:aldo/keto reductase [Bryobacteraceae bacterium]